MDMVWWHSNVLDELLALHWRSIRLQVERRRKTNKVQVVPTDRWPLPHKGGHSLQPLSIDVELFSLQKQPHLNSMRGPKWNPKKYELYCFNIDLVGWLWGGNAFYLFIQWRHSLPALTLRWDADDAHFSVAIRVRRWFNTEQRCCLASWFACLGRTVCLGLFWVFGTFPLFR